MAWSTESALRRWLTQPPAGADELHINALSYACEGGWTDGPDGTASGSVDS